jgi:8-oxo-dGTP pyrophosphatase MutT (NUDIX family)
MIDAVTILVIHPWDPNLYLGVTRKDDPNAWGLPGGKIDPGELPYEAAQRELFEETGLTSQGMYRVFNHPCRANPTKTGKTYQVVTYCATVSGEISTTEAGKVGWVNRDTLLAGPFGEYNRNLFEALDGPWSIISCCG